MTLRLVEPSLFDPHYRRSMAEVRQRIRAWRVGRARDNGELTSNASAGHGRSPGHLIDGPSLVRPSRHDWRDQAGPFIWAGVMFLGALAWCLAPALVGGTFMGMVAACVIVQLLVLLEDA